MTAALVVKIMVPAKNAPEEKLQITGPGTSGHGCHR